MVVIMTTVSLSSYVTVTLSYRYIATLSHIVILSHYITLSHSNTLSHPQLKMYFIFLDVSAIKIYNIHFLKKWHWYYRRLFYVIAEQTMFNLLTACLNFFLLTEFESWSACECAKIQTCCREVWTSKYVKFSKVS